MADYIYLLENRLSRSQQNALSAMREIARERGLTVFLVGGAVRDLTCGSPVRDLDVAVQGNALKLKKEIEKAGGAIMGENDALQSLFVKFAGGARVEVGSTLSVTYPKPGKPVAKPASILDDLRRRDFTANAMAISLNAGSYGLLMDPLNGVADIENRELRLVSNYGFIEDPIRMVRAARLMARLGWQMDEKTRARYATGKEEGYISAASAFQRGYETEEIVYEEDPIRVMRGLEAEGWMTVLSPSWTSSKANIAELERLRETQTQLQMQGIHPNTAAANFPLLTAKLSPKEVAELKASFARPGFVKEIESLESEAKDFSAQFSAKSAASPSQSWKLLHSAKPEAVLQVAHSSKSSAIQAKFKSFYTEWPLAKQKVPHVLLQEMRITPDLAGYNEVIESLIFEVMDGRLDTPEAMKAFLEPFSPPAPPPPVHLRRPRAAKKEAKSKGRAKKTIPDSSATPSGDNAVVPVPLTATKEPERQEILTESVAVAAKPAKKAAEAVAVAGAAPAKHNLASQEAAKKPIAKKAVHTKPVPLPVVKAKKTVTETTIVKKAAVPKNKKATVAKNSVAVKKVAVKAPVKAAAKKTAAKSPAKPAPSRRPVKKPAAKSPAKAVSKKPVAKKAIAKKATAKKAVPKKAAPKPKAKGQAKKAAAKVPAKQISKSRR